MKEQTLGLAELGQLSVGVLRDHVRFEEYEREICQIAPPLSDCDAECVLSILPDDENDYHGLAWSLLHLAESCPNIGQVIGQFDSSGMWIQEIKKRIARA